MSINFSQDIFIDNQISIIGKKKVHKFRLSVEDLMMGESKQKGKTPSTLKRRRSPSPASSGSAKAGTTPSTAGAGENKRKNSLQLTPLRAEVPPSAVKKDPDWLPTKGTVI